MQRVELVGEGGVSRRVVGFHLLVACAPSGRVLSVAEVGRTAAEGRRTPARPCRWRDRRRLSRVTSPAAKKPARRKTQPGGEWGLRTPAALLAANLSAPGFERETAAAERTQSPSLPVTDQRRWRPPHEAQLPRNGGRRGPSRTARRTPRSRAGVRSVASSTSAGDIAGANLMGGAARYRLRRTLAARAPSVARLFPYAKRPPRPLRIAATYRRSDSPG